MILDKRMEMSMGKEIFLRRIFHPSELLKMNPKKIAGIFAAKEATMKALNMSPKDWLDIEIRYDKKGRPSIILAKEIIYKEILSIDVSISHENGMTIAFVVVLLEKK